MVEIPPRTSRIWRINYARTSLCTNRAQLAPIEETQQLHEYMDLIDILTHLNIAQHNQFAIPTSALVRQ